MMMSRAWSQGTSFKRKVTLPVTVSLVTTLKLVKSAITCSSARTSMFWKLGESLRRATRAWTSLPGRPSGPALEHELVVALVGAVLPGAARLDHHAHAVARLRRRDALHRRAEVGDVEAAAQRVGQARAQEFDHQALALLADVDADLVVRQLDDDATGAVAAAAKVDLAQRQRRAVQALGEARGLRARAGKRRRRIVLERDDQHLALDRRVVAGRNLEVEDETRPVARLGDADRAQVALVDVDRRLAERVRDAGKVERDPGRRLDREAGRQRRERLAHLDPDDLGARLLRAVDRLDRVLARNAAPAIRLRAKIRERQTSILGCTIAPSPVEGAVALDPFAGRVLHDFG